MGFDLKTLDPAQITALVNEQPRRGFIGPAIENFVTSGEMIEDFSSVIDWPNNKDGSAKTPTQQVTALNQTIKNHAVKVLEGKAVAWPELRAVVGALTDSDQSVALLVNTTLVKARTAEASEDN